jgi:hypothetical protein
MVSPPGQLREKAIFQKVVAKFLNGPGFASYSSTAGAMFLQLQFLG